MYVPKRIQKGVHRKIVRVQWGLTAVPMACSLLQFLTGGRSLGAIGFDGLPGRTGAFDWLFGAC